MWHITKAIHATLFTFCGYTINPQKSTVSFTYRVTFKSGLTQTFTDRLYFENIAPDLWGKIPKKVRESTLQALLLMLGINYWCAFPTAMSIESFTLTKKQAAFWNTLYLNGLGEFFYLMDIDFRNLIHFPYDPHATDQKPTALQIPTRSLLLSGAGKDSILSAEILKEHHTPFDFFAFAPTPAHQKIAHIAGAKTIRVRRRRDPLLELILSGAYPSVSTFTFVAVLIAELLGYNEIVFSNERSADFGNLTYLGLPINHQWCKSTEAEKLLNDYIQSYITPSITTRSLLREFSELEIVKRFVRHPQYFHAVTSCNTYFALPGIVQRLLRKNFWCKRCPKCVFLFACFSAFLSKEEVVRMFGANLYTKKRLMPLFKRILGTEGFKPLDCVGEPEEMILAMHYASQTGAYADEPAMVLFEKHFPASYNFKRLEDLLLTQKPSDMTLSS